MAPRAGGAVPGLDFRRAIAYHVPFQARVAQWIERRFPKPQAAGSIPAVGAVLVPAVTLVYLDGMTYFMLLAFALWVFSYAVRHLPYEDGWSGDDGDEAEF